MKLAIQKAEIELLLESSYEQRGNDLQKSVVQVEKALELSRAIDDKALVAKSLNMYALFMMILSKNQQSLEMSEEAIQYFEELNDQLGIANAKYNIAGVYYKTDNYHLGMVNLIDCLKIYRQFDDKHNESRTQKSLGTIYELLGDRANAIVAYEESIKAAQLAKNSSLESNAYNPLSGIYLKMGRIDEAMEMIERSIAIKTDTGDRRGLAFAIYGRGKVHIQTQNYEQAEKDLMEALAIHLEAGEHFGEGMAYNKIAQLCIATGKREKAKKLLKKAIALSEKYKMSLIYFKCTYFLYEVFREEKNDSESLKYLEKYLASKESSTNTQTLKVLENYEAIARMDSMKREAQLENEKAAMILNQERIEQKAQMKQEFLSAMSHEIRTPLNAVTSIISLLEERSSENEKKLLTALRFSSKNLLRIINDILDYSKLDSNNMRLEEHSVVFDQVLHNILETYQSLAQEKGLHLDLNIAPSVANSYKMDETKLFQILGNLVSNAIKYTEKGVVSVQVKRIETTSSFDTLEFEVKDTGIGIPVEEQKRLFESFYIPPSVTTRSDGGTGLGLAIVKKLIELHGSTISLESQENEGSTFTFNLKLGRTSEPSKVNAASFQTLKNKKAILAEDNEINALVVRQLLQRWGMTIQRAKNGKEAIILAKKEAADFILMDIHMPEMNGFDATHTIRNSENPNKNTPIFALTADITAINQDEYKNKFDGFLLKPIQIERLFEALSNALSKPKKATETSLS